MADNGHRDARPEEALIEDQPHPHPRPTDVSLVFPPHPAWVRAARETVRTLLAATGRTELTDTAVLLTSEAVTNAINACAAKQCTAPVSLFAGYGDPGGHLRVLIHDEAPGLPRCQTPAEDDETGRGIQLISFGADAWGICTHGPGSGKATWFELGRRSPGGEGELSTGPATPENPPLL